MFQIEQNLIPSYIWILKYATLANKNWLNNFLVLIKKIKTRAKYVFELHQLE